jgi:SAM-dependent methyltransferase
MPDLLKWFFEFQYRFGKPRWDTGITPPEVVAMIEGGEVRGNRALDLGCGTGTNSIYLGQHGFHVVGVDFSPKAIGAAREKATSANVSVDFYVGDATRLDSLGVRDPFDFVLDIGCFHSIEPMRRQPYAKGIVRLTHPGALFMLYAFSPRKLLLRNVGVITGEVKQIFAKDFVLERIEEGKDRGEITSAWYWFRKT